MRDRTRSRLLPLQLAVPVTVLVGALAVAATAFGEADPAGDSGLFPPNGGPQAITNPRSPAPPQEGDTLTATDDYTPAAPGDTVVREYKWMSCTGDATNVANCTFIPSATGATYTLTASDVGKAIRVRIRGSNRQGSVEVGANEADSPPTDVVVNAPPVNSSPPTISDTTPQVGQNLTVNPGTWSGSPTFSHQWQRCTSTCSAAGTGLSYRVTSADVGKKLRVVETATNAGGSSSANSAQTATVPQPPSPTQKTTPPKTTPKTTAGQVFTLMSPFPVVRLSGRVLGRFTHLGRLVVVAPQGTRVTVICRGRRCPYKRASKRVRRRKVRFRLLERRLKAGTVIVVIVSRPGSIGKYTRIRIRKNRIPARVDRCAAPGSTRPMRCPSTS